MQADEKVQEQQRRAALNQSLFRQVNEAIELKHGSTGAAYTEYACECAQRTCEQTVPLTVDEYEEVRKAPTHFFVVPGHEHLSVERVVWESDRYVIVEKIGMGAKVAVRLDPRRHAA